MISLPPVLEKFSLFKSYEEIYELMKATKAKVITDKMGGEAVQEELVKLDFKL